jgi:hypothetical protein
MTQRRTGTAGEPTIARIAADMRQVRRLRETAQSAWSLGLLAAADWMLELSDTIETQALKDMKRLMPEWDAHLRLGRR